MAANVLMKTFCVRNLLATKLSPSSFCLRVLFSSKDKDDKSTPKEVVVNQEDPVQDRKTYQINWKRLKRSWMYFRQYTNLYKDNSEVNEDGFNNLILRMKKKDEIIYYMRTKEDLDHWFVMTDEDIGGRSWAELRQGSNEMTMLFRGYLNQKAPGYFKDMKPITEPTLNDMKGTFTGSAFVETKPFYGVYDSKESFSTEEFNSYEIRLRGDGRRYWFETTCEYFPTERLVYRYPIYTRGGPLWEVVHIPFVKMHSRSDINGKMILKQRPFIPNLITNFRFLLNDGIEGPFQLEIDYIALTNNIKHGDINDTTDVYDPWEPINVGSGA